MSEYAIPMHELADMTIPRWTAHPIPPARSPIREILPMIPATAIQIYPSLKIRKAPDIL